MTQTAGLSPEMRDMIVQTMKQVVHRDLPDDKLLALDADDRFPTEFIRELLSPNVGLHLIFLPENVGGLGGGALDICRVSEEMAALDLGVATAFLAICLGTDPIVVGGTQEQKDHWLGRIASEGLIVAYGVTEPGAGSNVAALETVAERVTDADGNVTHYRITGRKQWITNGSVAQLYTILAKTPDGPSFFVVERDTPGLQPGKHEEKHGIRASDTAAVILEDVTVPASHLIGGVEGQGLKQANAVFGYTRLMVGAFGLGCGREAMERAVRYAKERVQFGTPLIEKEGFGVKLLAPHWVDLVAGRAYVEEIAHRIDGGEDDLQVEGSIAKLWSTEAGNRAADAAIQALGGYGYAREYMVEKIRRDVRITTIYEGTSEIQQSIIGLYRWKATVRSKGGFYEELATALDGLHAASPQVGADLVAAATRDLNTVILHCHGARIASRQAVQFRLADMMAGVEVAGALCRRAAGMEKDGEAWAAMARACARRVLADVRRGAVQCLIGYLDPADEAAKAAARAVADALHSADPFPAHLGLLEDLGAVTDHLKTCVD
ncbi:MAG TPA: acyl-CoA dehydrogenase family protein [Candidatus Krumholzibacteria bacterium]|nr:acyl-CoA dehydrogenase family protein [Candidatus Krumholzibacteria bacterium]HRX50440.1 acyl-CoA dehydrogenase family protein [Candidatus Krumholzibacteria bacterium]